MSKESIRKIIKCPSIPTPLGPYSQAVFANNHLFISGVLGTDADGNFAGDDTILQAKKALENIATILEEIGLKRNNVVKCTVLLTDIKDINAMNEVYREFFKPNFPARTCFQGNKSLHYFSAK
jgi:2-iminobutanoate/2-iminopropanoate deaminase